MARAGLPSISSDGRFVVFASDATNLVPGDNNGFADIFLRDTCNGAPSGCTPTTTLISVAADGSAANGASAAPSISPDGRYVAFDSIAANLVLDNSSSSTAGSSVSAASESFLRDTCHGGPQRLHAGDYALDHVRFAGAISSLVLKYLSAPHHKKIKLIRKQNDAIRVEPYRPRER